MTTFDPDDMPAPAAALVLWKLHAEALVSVLGPKKAQRYLRTMAETMATEAAFADVIHIRRGPIQEQTAKARREAAAYFECALPLLLARSRR